MKTTFLDKLRNAWRSKTVWFNGLLLLALAFSDQILAALPGLQQYLPADLYQRIGMVAGIANLVLRFVTAHPLEAK